MNSQNEAQQENDKEIDSQEQSIPSSDDDDISNNLDFELKKNRNIQRRIDAILALRKVNNDDINTENSAFHFIEVQREIQQEKNNS